jgi:tape measure domain-containing protein
MSWETTGINVEVKGSSSLTQAAHRAEKLDNSLDKAARGANHLQREMNGVHGGARQLQGSTGALINSTTLLAGGFTLLAAGAVATVARQMVSLSSQVISTGAMFEVMGKQMETLEGSSGKAAQAIEWIKETAQKTPFEIADLQSAFMRFKAYGLDPMDGTLTSIGDAVAAFGGSAHMMNSVTRALGQMAAKGKVSGEEMRQLAELGIPAYDILQKKLNLTNAEIANIGDQAIKADRGIAALVEGLNERYGGAMEKQMATYTGIMSNLQDTISLFFSDISDAGVLDAAADVLKDFMDNIQEMRDSGDLEALGSAIALSIETIGGSLNSVIDIFQTLTDLLSSPAAATLIAMTPGASGVLEAVGQNVTARRQNKLADEMKATHTAVKEVFGDLEGLYAYMDDVLPRGAEGFKEAFGEGYEAIRNYVNHLRDEGIPVTGELNELLLAQEKAMYGTNAVVRQQERDAKKLIKAMVEEAKEAGAVAAAAKEHADKLNEKIAAQERDKEIRAEIMGMTAEELEFQEQVENGLGLLSLAYGETADAAGEAGTAVGEVFELGDEEALKIAEQRLQMLRDRFKEMWEGVAADSRSILFNSIGDSFILALTGRSDEIESMLTSMFENLGANVFSGFWGQFSTFLEGSLTGSGPGLDSAEFGTWFSEGGGYQQALTGIGMMGLSGAMQRQNRGAAALQGAASGALTGAFIGGGAFSPVGMAVGAIVGGALAYFGSGGQETPQSQLYMGDMGTAARLGTRGHQGISAEENEMWRMEYEKLWRGFNETAVDAFRAFGDTGLLEFIEEIGSISTGGWLDMNVQELQQWLQNIAMPDAFMGAYGEAFKGGLDNLGFSAETINHIFSELSDMAGEERFTALADFVSIWKRLHDYMADWAPDNLVAWMNEDPFQIFKDGIIEATDQVHLLRSTWDSIGLLDRASDLQTIGSIWESVTQETVAQLQMLYGTVEAGMDFIAGLRESMALEGMDPQQQANYFVEQIDYWQRMLEEATTPMELSEAQQNLEDYIRALYGLDPGTATGGPVTPGATVGELLEQILTDYETALAAQRDMIETDILDAYGSFVDEVNRATDALTNFADELEDTVGAGKPGEDFPDMPGGGGGGGGGDLEGGDPKSGTLSDADKIINAIYNAVPSFQVNIGVSDDYLRGLIQVEILNLNLSAPEGIGI